MTAAARVTDPLTEARRQARQARHGVAHLAGDPVVGAGTGDDASTFRPI